MTFPTLLFGFVVASLWGALYHVWRGGGPGRILFYLVLAWVGFFGGTFLANLKGWMLLSVGLLDVGAGSVGALLILFAGDWLTKINMGEG